MIYLSGTVPSYRISKTNSPRLEAELIISWEEHVEHSLSSCDGRFRIESF